MSTHFAERAGHTENYKLLGLIPTSKVNQRGIEDYQSLMPGNGGTMLFDKLAPAARGWMGSYLKIESVGCPPFAKQAQKAQATPPRFFVALDPQHRPCHDVLTACRAAMVQRRKANA